MTIEFEPWEDNNIIGVEGKKGEIQNHQAAISISEFLGR